MVAAVLRAPAALTVAGVFLAAPPRRCPVFLLTAPS